MITFLILGWIFNLLIAIACMLKDSRRSELEFEQVLAIIIPWWYVVVMIKEVSEW